MRNANPLVRVGSVNLERARTIDEILDLRRDLGRWMHRGLPHEWLDVEITMSQLKTLLVLYGMERASMGELADALGTGVSTVTGIVDRLVEHGLVVREEDPRDRRIVYGRPTAEGLALMDRLVIATRERLARLLTNLSDEDLATICAADRALVAAARGS